MIEDYLCSGAFRVVKAAVSLFDGTLTASPTIGSWPSGITGRCKVTVSSVSGHTDCAGSLTIGSESHTFTAAGQTWITTTLLTSKPAVSSSGLDCHCHITVIDSGGADVVAETLTAIDTRIESHSSLIPTANGLYTVVQDTQIISNTLLAVNDVVRKGTTDYIIKKADDNPDLGQESDFYTYLA